MKEHIIKTLLTFLTLCLNCNLISAQEIQASLSHYSTDEGLSSNAISDIIQDKYGYVWIATWNGLCRFDGYNFYNYATGGESHIPLLHNRILDITADKDANIWMRMYDGRVFVLNRKTDKICYAFEKVKDGNHIKTEKKITADNNGNVFIIISQRGIYRLRLNNNIITSHFIDLHNIDISSICEDTRGRLWISSNKGLQQLNIKSNKNVIKKHFCINENITCAFAKSNSIYGGTKTGKIIMCSNGREKTIKSSDNKEITSLFIDNEGLIWFTAQKQGVSKLNPSNGNIKEFTQKVIVPEFDLHGGSFIETNGIVWARMNKGGFGYYNRRDDIFEYFHNNPDNTWNLSNTIATYYSSPNGVVWISTSQRGLEKLEILKERIKRTLIEPYSNNMNVNEIRAMYYDKTNKQLWIGNKESGLYIFDNRKRTVINRDNEGKPFGRIYGLTKDSYGNIWMCTKGNGIYIINEKINNKLQFKHFKHDSNDKYSISSDNAYIALEDKMKNIWIATYGGGVNLIYKTKDGKYKFINSNNIMHNYPNDAFHKVRTLAADTEGNIWAGTSDGIIILRYDKRKGIITKKIVSNACSGGDGLASNDIIHIVSDGHGTMWIATNGGGLSRTAGRDEKGKILFETFNEKDGLPSGEVRSVTFDKLGNVWFATDHIICSFDINKHLFSTLSIQDGVDNTMCSECAAITLDDGKMLFGTLNGYYTVDRKELINSQASILKLKITDFYINDKLISPRLNNYYDYYVPDSNYVKLPSRSSVFSFRFTSLNYQLQHRVYYQYMLEGFDKTWKIADRSHTVSYSDVPAGSYKFKVRAFLLESPDKYDIRVIRIEVPPYVLASAGALEIYLIVFIIIIIGILYYRHDQKERIKKMRVLKVGPQEIAFKHKDDYDFVVEQLNWLEQHYTESNLKIEDMVAQSSLSRTSYYNKIKTLVGVSPKEFISDFRIKKAEMYLLNDNCTISEVAYNTGFNDPVYFTRLFKTKTGVTPSKYREDKKVAVSENDNTEKKEV